MCRGGILVEASTPESWDVLFRRVVVVVCCAVFLILAAAKYPSVKARASEGFQPISPEELKMTSEPLAPGAPAIILYPMSPAMIVAAGPFTKIITIASRS
jgi:hypothetical protein